MNVTLESIYRELKIIRNILSKPAKETWVSVYVIKDITIWKGREQMRKARENGLVKYDSKKGYLLESINPLFLKSKET